MGSPQDGLGGSLIPHSFNQTRCMLALAKFIVKNEISFRMVESEGFRELFAEVQPRFILPDRKKCASSIWDLFTVEKAKLKSIIGDQRVSITTDTWTSIQNINYMVTTAHFVDIDWKLHKRIIAFTKINSHKGDEIGRVLENCLNEWGVDKIFTITIDNASANDTAIGYIRRRLEYSNSLLLNGKYLHLRCVCHVLNLIVKDGLKFYCEAVEGIRNLVKYIHSSPSRLDRFRYFSNLMKNDKMAIVPLDCSTRWNATYKMLDAAYKFRKVFDRMCLEDEPIKAYFNEMVKDKKKNFVKRTGPPKNEDWEKGRILVEFLKGFYKTTLKLSATKSVTSSLIFDEVILIQDAIEQATNNIHDSNLQNVAKLMKVKFDKYWGSIEVINKVIFIAHILDPRYKFQSLKISFLDIGWSNSKVNEFLEVIKHALNELYDEYRKGMNIPNVLGSNVVVRIEEIDEQFDDDLRSKKLKRLQQTRREEQSLEITNEVDQYLNDPFENLMSRDFHLLDWWKGNQTKYPILSKIAKDILAIPSSTVASESAFILGRRVINPFRASLAPKMVEALVCLSDWLRAENFSCLEMQFEEDIELFMDTEAICEGINMISARHVSTMIGPGGGYGSSSSMNLGQSNMLEGQIPLQQLVHHDMIEMLGLRNQEEFESKSGSENIEGGGSGDDQDPNCGGPAAIGEMSFDEHHLRIENARLREEINKISGIASKYIGKPMSSSYPLIPPGIASRSTMDIGVGNMANEIYGNTGDLLRSVSGQSEIDKPMIIELAVAAMEELVRMAQLNELLWCSQGSGGSEVLNEEEYVQNFPRGIGQRPFGLKAEASRETAVVIMNHINLVEILMDVNQWSTVFSGIVSRAITLEVLSTGIAGNCNGALQVMSAEFQVPSPLVPTRESLFVRYCKQHSDSTWAVVDVSLDSLRPSPVLRCRRRPSGCLIQEMPNGYSKVTWVEHVEVDDRSVHNIYKPLVNSGLAFGAKRWVSTLDRQCERLASVMASNIPQVDGGVIQTAEGRKSMLKLAERMVISFCGGMGASTTHQRTMLLGSGTEDVRVMTRKRVDDPGRPTGIVLDAATSFWLPVPPKRVFDFFRDESSRSEWDILSNRGVVQEMAHIANGRDHGNSVSLLRVNSPNSNQSNMLILQESCIDSTGSYVIYAPVDVVAMNVVLNGGDPDYVALLPWGFAILPDGAISDHAQNGGPIGEVGSGGSLLTVAFQILVDSVPTAKLSLGSVANVHSLIACTVERIKAAVSVEAAHK